jgi:hypothetical protein
MEPLLLTAADVPAGYVTRGPQLSPPSGTPEFFDALPSDVPVAYVMFSMNAGQDLGGVAPSQDGITEAIAKAASPGAAIALLQKVEAAVSACGGSGVSIVVPGSVPNLVASEQTGGTASQSIATAEVFAVMGNYIVEARWFNSNLANPTDQTSPAAAATPTAQAIGAVIDSALRRIPMSQ